MYLFALLISFCLFKGIEPYQYTAQVGKVLAQCGLTVYMQRIQRHHTVKLLHQHISPLAELHRVGKCPPVGQVTFFIKFSSLVIKSMRYLVAYCRCPCVAIYHRIIQLFVAVSRHRHHCSRQHYLVVRFVVVSIVSLRCHAPLIAVYWLA